MADKNWLDRITNTCKGVSLEDLKSVKWLSDSNNNNTPDKNELDTKSINRDKVLSCYWELRGIFRGIIDGLPKLHEPESTKLQDPDTRCYKACKSWSERLEDQNQDLRKTYKKICCKKCNKEKEIDQFIKCISQSNQVVDCLLCTGEKRKNKEKE